MGAVELYKSALYVRGAPGAPSAGEYTRISDALVRAYDYDTIIVSGVITETGIVITKNVTLRGPDPALDDAVAPLTHMGFVQAAQTPSSNCGSGSSIFTVQAGRTATIANLNIRNGCAPQGGGINNAGNLTLAGVTIAASRAITGGAVFNSGALSITNSTLFSNSVSTGGQGSGIYNTGSLAVRNATLAGNGSRVIQNNGTISISASLIISGTGGTAVSCGETIANGGSNLVFGGSCGSPPVSTADPQLGSLRDNGGPTLTMAPVAGSPAINAGGACGSIATNVVEPGRSARPATSAPVEYGVQRWTVCENCNPIRPPIASTTCRRR